MATIRGLRCQPKNPWHRTRGGPAPSRVPTRETPSSVRTVKGTAAGPKRRERSLAGDMDRGYRPLPRPCRLLPSQQVRRILFLTDRPPHEVLPAASTLGADLKAEPLSPEALARLPDIAPDMVVADGED